MNTISYNQLAITHSEKELNMFKCGLCDRDIFSKNNLIEIEKDTFVTFETFMRDMAYEVFMNGVSAESYIYNMIKRYEFSVGTENYGAKNVQVAAFHDFVKAEVYTLLRRVDGHGGHYIVTYNNVRDGRFGLEQESLLEIFNGFASLCKNCMRRTEFSKINKNCFLSDIEKFDIVFAEWSHDFQKCVGTFNKRVCKQYYFIGVERHVINNEELDEEQITDIMSDFVKMKYGEEVETIIFIHKYHGVINEVVALAVISD